MSPYLASVKLGLKDVEVTTRSGVAGPSALYKVIASRRSTIRFLLRRSLILASVAGPPVVEAMVVRRAGRRCLVLAFWSTTQMTPPEAEQGMERQHCRPPF